MSNKTPPQEDSWAWVKIGDPFPDNPVKVLGQQNMYVALWYKHGKPIHGRAWNNGGVVECSFPFSKVELTGARDLGGQIQVLQYKGNHVELGYWYNWIKYSERVDKFAQTANYEPVRCGASFPLLWADRKEGALLGYVDNTTEIANFSHDKINETKKGNDLSNMMMIIRELKGGPPTCDCAACPKGTRPVVRVMLNEWADFRAGDPFPPAKCVRALNKSLDTLPGESPDQYIALWYQQGEPVMGRVWNDKGKIAANFSWGGHEYKTNIGSLQVLFEMPEHVRGFDYGWRPFPEAAKFGEKEWHPVHINFYKGDISPGVIQHQGKEILGKVDIKNERACFGYGGAEVAIVGSAVHSTKVLCRKAKPGCKFD
ncbi:unnamed protein product [Bursaphelenchus okinawaensis]|uniref:Uncharacterized protein n=1 Tax=Bursaphelenchus okinawaensis TaxID=465554 RepID=A0A811KXJ7_9BILA|nr:unnamed protein product [Bursaphelenchus okinawaensis]CAG9113303.1 unnamed protein product [Bursaphelenchus okinawaensis]